MSDTIRPVNETLQAFALGLPGAYEDHPWDEVVIKVHKKIFVFFGMAAAMHQRVLLGVKLPETGIYALQMPFVKPSGYNLGKYGWVTIQFPPDEHPPVDLLLEWIEESYRAVAPKRLIAQLDSSHAGTTPQEP